MEGTGGSICADAILLLTNSAPIQFAVGIPGNVVRVLALLAATILMVPLWLIGSLSRHHPGAGDSGTGGVLPAGAGPGALAQGMGYMLRSLR